MILILFFSSCFHVISSEFIELHYLPLFIPSGPWRPNRIFLESALHYISPLLKMTDEQVLESIITVPKWAECMPNTLMHTVRTLAYKEKCENTAQKCRYRLHTDIPVQNAKMWVKLQQLQVKIKDGIGDEICIPYTLYT
ncbi:hypothetical protein AABB24_017948 [Solanum stoloniferum]|uniref:Uncharacterized protein n=1 Tax=Solanum stoloniferum TaxID=62892 RepID=A0ABD2TMG0_9SOLN